MSLSSDECGEWKQRGGVFNSGHVVSLSLSLSLFFWGFSLAKFLALGSFHLCGVSLTVDNKKREEINSVIRVSWWGH